MEILFVRFLKNPVGATYLHQITVLCGVFFQNYINIFLPYLITSLVLLKNMRT